MRSRAEQVIVITAANQWDERRMADHQLASAISGHADVLYVDPPSLRRPEIVTEADSGGRITVLRPVRLPLARLRAVAYLNRYLSALQVRVALRRCRPGRITLLEANMTSPVAGLIGEDAVVYWAQDDWQGLAPLVGLNGNTLERNERLLVRDADAVIAANPLLAKRISEQRADVFLIPFGVTTEVFERMSVRADVADEGCAVLMGTLNTRIDFDILEAVVRAGVRLIIAGPVTEPAVGGRLADLVQSGLVEHVGAVPFESLPDVLGRACVGLVPYDHSRFNEGSFPLKTLEYLSAGLPVVATDLPAIRWLNSPDVRIADQPEAFAEAVSDLVGRGIPRPAQRSRRVEFARQHDWRTRAQEFAQVLGVVVTPVASAS